MNNKIIKDVSFKSFFSSLRICYFSKKHYLWTDKSRPLPIRTAYPAGHFLYIDMRYTKQAMTLAQQKLEELETAKTSIDE